MSKYHPQSRAGGRSEIKSDLNQVKMFRSGQIDPRKAREESMNSGFHAWDS